ncbi:MAG: hypothetical protein OJF49_004698 [Ktedonobacterales bacterium]|nr:MAG: hypothetical protein OJF49_004698 [Ktedonobacterales bacterium]
MEGGIGVVAGPGGGEELAQPFEGGGELGGVGMEGVGADLVLDGGDPGADGALGDAELL